MKKRELNPEYIKNNPIGYIKSTKALAKALDCDIRTINRYVRFGMQRHKISSKDIYYKISEVQNWIDSH